MISPARTVAFDVLLRVETEGAFATDLLAQQTEHLSSADAGLAEEITLGALRVQAQLDYLIKVYSGKAAKLDPEVRIALRMGVYQQRYLERIPTYAAVGESVELVKKARKRSAAGFVNAVLRKVTRDPVTWPDRATELSIPVWLLERWQQEFGPEVATQISKSALRRPETYIRVRSGDIPPPELTLEPADIPGAFRVMSGRATESTIQDVGSQSIVPLLGLQPGQTLLDVCAAPGNKTAQALESGVKAIACDIYGHRLKRLGGCARIVLDARSPLPFRTQFDRVLVDAPCSGTGTLARNPEIKWRLQPSDLEELHGKQVQIARQALTAVRPGGRMVYSTCSLERLENEDVIREAFSGVAGVRIVHEMRRIPGVDAGDGFYAAVLDVDGNGIPPGVLESGQAVNG